VLRPDLGRDTELGLGAAQQLGVALPELDALLDPLRREHDGPVLVPGLGLGRAGDRGDDAVLELGVLEHRGQLGAVVAVLAGHLVDKAALLGVEGRLRAACHAEQRGQQDKSAKSARHRSVSQGLRAAACDGCEWP